MYRLNLKDRFYVRISKNNCQAEKDLLNSLTKEMKKWAVLTTNGVINQKEKQKQLLTKEELMTKV